MAVDHLGQRDRRPAMALRVRSVRLLRQQLREVQRDLRLARRDHRLYDLALVSAIVILLGAEIDAEMEHQTARDTTEGAPKPMGARGARVGDTLG